MISIGRKEEQRTDKLYRFLSNREIEKRPPHEAERAHMSLRLWTKSNIK